MIRGAVPNNFDGRWMWYQDKELPQPVPQGWSVDNAITANAIEFLKDRDKDKPFFLYVATSGPHWPFVAPEEDRAPFIGKYDVG